MASIRAALAACPFPAENGIAPGRASESATSSRNMEEFYRLKRLPPYVFAEVNALKAKARSFGSDVIDLGMGNPDGPTPPHIVQKLLETVQNPRAHGYSVSRGIM